MFVLRPNSTTCIQATIVLKFHFLSDKKKIIRHLLSEFETPTIFYGSPKYTICLVLILNMLCENGLRLLKVFIKTVKVLFYLDNRGRTGVGVLLYSTELILKFG